MDERILIHKRLRDLSKYDKQAVDISYKPCDECKKLMTMGYLLIGVDETKTTDNKNPYRTGQIWVIKHEAAARIFDDISKGAAFISMEAAERIGLIPAPTE
jgi:hypothetical protein